jgi:hypothetical protein
MNLDFNDLALRTIQSQYGASPHIIGIIEAAAKQLDPTGDIKTFYNKVFNPLTAEGVGLNVWGRIVGASRYLPVDNEDFFGFYGQNLNPMNQAPFFNTGDTDLFRLTDEAYRTLIFLKAAANIGTATLPSIKEILTALFAEPVLVMNIGNMKVRVVFEFFLTPYQRAIFEIYGLFNLGAGVGFEFYQIDPKQTFGFNGSNLQPFNQGVFQPYPIQQGA